MTTTTKVSELKINKLSKAQYATIEPSVTELYFLTDGEDIPSLEGQSGKFLTTNGSEASWAEAGSGDINVIELASSGTVTLTDNAVHKIEPTGSVTFDVPGANWEAISEWSTPIQVGTSTWRGITYANNKFVAVGDSGYISTSIDGTTWTTPVQVGTYAWYGITYANNKFVAVGGNGYITTSTDGSTWDTPFKVGTFVWYGIIYANNKFVAVGSSGYITTSTDGTTWTTPVQVETSTSWHEVTYANNKFVAVGLNGYITTSTDGTTWTTPVQVGSSAWYGVTHGNNKFVAVGGNGYITTSTDGSTWTTPQQVGTSHWDGVTYENNKFIAVGTSGYTSTSTDGTTWTTPVQVGTNFWYEVTYANGKFVAIGQSGYITTKTFTEHTSPVTLDNTKYHQILVQMNLSSAQTIDLGLGPNPHFFENANPNLSNAGMYNILYEYDKANQYWVVGTRTKGVDQ